MPPPYAVTDRVLMIRSNPKHANIASYNVTDKQREVIERVAATDVAAGSTRWAGSVFVYAESAAGCCRYLLDPDGRVLDYARFYPTGSHLAQEQLIG